MLERLLKSLGCLTECWPKSRRENLYESLDQYWTPEQENFPHKPPVDGVSFTSGFGVLGPVIKGNALT